MAMLAPAAGGDVDGEISDLLTQLRDSIRDGRKIVDSRKHLDPAT
jgi:hypothetical protein